VTTAGRLAPFTSLQKRYHFRGQTKVFAVGELGSISLKLENFRSSCPSPTFLASSKNGILNSV
jgi:hypothetical protein